jgi:hypothetical protein
MSAKRKFAIQRDEDLENLDNELDVAMSALDGVNEKVVDLLGEMDDESSSDAEQSSAPIAEEKTSESPAKEGEASSGGSEESTNQ